MFEGHSSQSYTQDCAPVTAAKSPKITKNKGLYMVNYAVEEHKGVSYQLLNQTVVVDFILVES